MADIVAIKAAIDSNITNQTANNSITPTIVGTQMKAIADELEPYKKYVAQVSQTSTNAPVVTVLENTIGDIVWSYNSGGFYPGVLAGAFPTGKTWLMLNVAAIADNAMLRWVDEDTIALHSQDGFPPAGNIGLAQDGVLNNCSIEIRVYP